MSKVLKAIPAVVIFTVFFAAKSYASPAEGAYSGTQVTYDFGFFASLLAVAALGALLYFLKSKTTAKKQ